MGAHRQSGRARISRVLHRRCLWRSYLTIRLVSREPAGWNLASYGAEGAYKQAVPTRRMPDSPGLELIEMLLRLRRLAQV